MEFVDMRHDEPGISLRASGWLFDGITKGGSWDTPARPREDNAPICKKQRWLKILKKEDADHAQSYGS